MLGEGAFILEVDDLLLHNACPAHTHTQTHTHTHTHTKRPVITEVERRRDHWSCRETAIKTIENGDKRIRQRMRIVLISIAEAGRSRWEGRTKEYREVGPPIFIRMQTVDNIKS